MLNYTEDGQGRPVILIHGIAASLCDWSELRSTLGEAGFRTLAVDLPGHGDSPHPTDPARFNLRSVYTGFEEWVAGLSLDAPVNLVGHSLGGYLSLRFALRHPQQVRSLILINPLYCVAQIKTALHAFRRRPAMGAHLVKLAPAWLIDQALGWDDHGQDRFTPEVRRQIALDYKRASPHFVNITRLVPDLTPELERVQHPALVVYGDQDRTLNPAYFARLVARLPNATPLRVKGSGHLPHIARPQEVNPQVVQFLQQVQ